MVPGSEIGVASFLVTFLAGESVAGVVGVTRFTLVKQRFSPRHVLQMLVCGTVCVSHPAGAAQMVAVLPIGGVTAAPMCWECTEVVELSRRYAVRRIEIHNCLFCNKSRIGRGMTVESSDVSVCIPLATKNLSMFLFSFHAAKVQQ